MAEKAWSEFVVSDPPTDHRDAGAFLIRRRARRALGLAMGAGPCTHERLTAQSQRPLPRLARVLRASGHRWCRVGAKFYCSKCSSFSTQD
eukprot:6837914-Pyramimonas_sp.AAC.1